MTITTNPRIWAHRQLLPVVHDGNCIIEAEAGQKAATLTVAWGLDDSGDRPSLSVTVLDTASPRGPFSLNGLTDVARLRSEFQKWNSASQA
jgi:hypothetical protein